MADNNNGAPQDNDPMLPKPDSAQAPILTYDEALRETIIFEDNDETKGQRFGGSIF